MSRTVGGGDHVPGVLLRNGEADVRAERDAPLARHRLQTLEKW